MATNVKDELKDRADDAVAAAREAADRASGAMEETAERSGAAAEGAMRQAEGVVERAKMRAENVVEEIRTDVPKLADEARAKADAVGRQVGERAEAALDATGGELQHLAENVRQKAPEGKIGELVRSGADALDHGGSYLQEKNLGDLRGDIEGVIRRHPVEAIVAGVALGILLARTARG